MRSTEVEVEPTKGKKEESQALKRTREQILPSRTAS